MVASFSRRSLLAAAAQAPLWSAWPVGAQQQVPEDPILDEIYSSTLLAVAPTYTGACMAPYLEASRLFMQSALLASRLVADDRFMTAWTTNSFAQVDQEIRAAHAAGLYVLQKLREDIAWYEEEYNRIAAPGFQPRTRIEQEAANRRAALIALMRDIEPPLTTAGQELIGAFDGARTAIVGRGSYSRLEVVRASRTLIAAMGRFRDAAATAETKIEETLDRGREVPDVVGGRTVRVQPMPRRQVRVQIENDSDSLVFFVRIHARQRDGTYVLRDDTKRWIPVYPRDAQAAMPPSTDPNATRLVSLPLANRVWLPAKVWDRLEIRVATYGEHRRTIRWRAIRGQQVRPALNCLQRGFYWLAYELHRSMQAGDMIVTRLRPTAESYEWRFEGTWNESGALGPQWQTTDLAELSELPPASFPIAFQRNHFTWTMPSGVQTISSNPIVEATVTGNATIQRVGPSSRDTATLQEAGRGKLVIEMTLW